MVDLDNDMFTSWRVLLTWLDVVKLGTISQVSQVSSWPPSLVHSHIASWTFQIQIQIHF